MILARALAVLVRFGAFSASSASASESSAVILARALAVLVRFGAFSDFVRALLDRFFERLGSGSGSSLSSLSKGGGRLSLSTSSVRWSASSFSASTRCESRSSSACFSMEVISSSAASVEVSACESRAVPDSDSATGCGSRSRAVVSSREACRLFFFFFFFFDDAVRRGLGDSSEAVAPPAFSEPLLLRRLAELFSLRRLGFRLAPESERVAVR